MRTLTVLVRRRWFKGGKEVRFSAIRKELVRDFGRDAFFKATPQIQRMLADAQGGGRAHCCKAPRRCHAHSHRGW